MTVQIETYNPAAHFLEVCHWIQQRTQNTMGKDGFALDRWETQFSPERMGYKDNHTALFYHRNVLLGVAVGESPDEYHFLRLDDTDEDLWLAMFEWVKAHCEQKPFKIWVAHDSTDAELLERTGFVKQHDSCVNYSLALTEQIPLTAVPAGYAVMDFPIADVAWREKLCLIDNLCFPWANSTEHTIFDLAFMPSYQQRLHKCIVDAEKNVAAFSILWADSRNQLGVFEPVATHPDHRRRGLASTLMKHLLHEAFGMGIRTFRVGAFSEEARSTYYSVGFDGADISHAWRWQTPTSA